MNIEYKKMSKVADSQTLYMRLLSCTSSWSGLFVKSSVYFSDNFYHSTGKFSRHIDDIFLFFPEK